MALAANGYGSCFGCLISRYETSLLNYATWLCRDSEFGRDIFQDAVIELIRKVQDPADEVRTGEGFLRTHIYRRSIDLHRRRKRIERRMPLAVVDTDSVAASTTDSTLHQDDESVERRNLHDQIVQLIRSKGTIGEAVLYSIRNNKVAAKEVIQKFDLEMTPNTFVQRRRRMIQEARDILSKVISNWDEGL